MVMMMKMMMMMMMMMMCIKHAFKSENKRRGCQDHVILMWCLDAEINHSTTSQK